MLTTRNKSNSKNYRYHYCLMVHKTLFTYIILSSTAYRFYVKTKSEDFELPKPKQIYLPKLEHCKSHSYNHAVNDLSSSPVCHFFDKLLKKSVVSHRIYYRTSTSTLLLLCFQHVASCIFFFQNLFCLCFKMSNRASSSNCEL